MLQIILTMMTVLKVLVLLMSLFCKMCSFMFRDKHSLMLRGQNNIYNYKMCNNIVNNRSN